MRAESIALEGQCNYCRMMSRNQSDLGEYPRPHLTVDLVLMTICDQKLQLLLIRRELEPFKGRWALPGSFVREREMLDEGALRILTDKTGLPGTKVEQLYTFSTPDRDPRGWVVSTAYFALVPQDTLQGAVANAEGLRLQPVRLVENGLEYSGMDPDFSLPFDHDEMVRTALERLRGKLDWSLIAFDLLPERFTLLELQQVHESILGRELNKPTFRKKMLDREFADGRRLIATGEFTRGRRHRPAELYRIDASGSKGCLLA